ncbi:hypothetical protein R3P38DRAFT_3367397 [Favolaschia claudopus]|uniref:Uncharacterized protein n=1 Tax=Favolaschia claudopus TaxID=2862362 RepID=A0AAW0AA77_9AGAR
MPPTKTLPEGTKECSQSKCNVLLPKEGPKTCDRCREQNNKDQRAHRAKRKAEKESEEARKRSRTENHALETQNNEASPQINEEDVSADEENDNVYEQFADAQAMFDAIRKAFKTGKSVNFRGTYLAANDPLITDKERLQMTTDELWKVSGYRFSNPSSSSDTPFDPSVISNSGAGNNSASAGESGDEGDDEELLVLQERKTYNERLTARLEQLRDFCDGLEYQRQFGDTRFLDTLEREGAGMFRLIETCTSRERRENSRRYEGPTTWETSSANAMFYRTRPSLADRDT